MKGKKNTWGDGDISQNSYLFRLFADIFFVFNRGKQRQPFVLCGTNSRRIVIDDVRSCRKSVNSEISKCGIDSEPAKFMVC